jgi:hypothetical protein
MLSVRRVGKPVEDILEGWRYLSEELGYGKEEPVTVLYFFADVFDTRGKGLIEEVDVEEGDLSDVNQFDRERGVNL